MIDPIGLAARLWRRARFRRLPFASIGADVEWHRGTITDAGNIRIGSHVYIGPGASIHGRGGVRIGDGVIFGPRLTIHSSSHNHRAPRCVPYDGGVRLGPVTVGDAVWTGDGVMLCPGVTVGRGAVIAMGSVVSRDVPPFSVVAGNPARVVAMREDPERLDALIRDGAFYLKLKREGRIAHFDIPR